MTQGSAGGALPLPPGLPSGVDPATYKLDEVRSLLRRAAYFPLFSVHNPDVPNVPIPVPGRPGALAGMEVHENTHRFRIAVEEEGRGGLQAVNVLGDLAAHVGIRWLTTPDDFFATPHRDPPPTPISPDRQQRFVMLDGRFDFVDADGSGIRGFGTGRTFPQVIAGEPSLVIGANIVVLEGLGRLAGLDGCVVVNGFIRPPTELFIQIMMRVMDPAKRLETPWELSPIHPHPSADPTATFLTFLGEEDPDRPTELIRAPDGTMIGSRVHELLRLVDLGFDLGPGGRRLQARTRTGPVVGRLATRLDFNPLDPTTPGTSLSPIPYRTREGILSFLDGAGRELGTLKADVVEGRGFRTELEGAPMPVFRLVGFGPLLEGTGCFQGVRGMLSMNGVVSVFPRTLSNLYVLRIEDPEGRYRTAVGG